jgi:hypothetical protein
MLLILAAATLHAAPCTTSLDCSLNGDCVSGGCVCDAAWSGSAQCDVLAVEPSPGFDSSGYRNSSGYHSWGGNAIEVDGTWHLFVAQVKLSYKISHT